MDQSHSYSANSQSNDTCFSKGLPPDFAVRLIRNASCSLDHFNDDDETGRRKGDGNENPYSKIIRILRESR